MTNLLTLELEGFSKDVTVGLTKTNKSIPSRYFYDKEGSRLFQRLMETKDYYPTACEYSILEKNAPSILKPFTGTKPFDLVEFGAGDGKKTKLLINHLVKSQFPFRYIPIDISGDILSLLEKDLKFNYPNISIKPIEKDYFKALEEINQNDQNPKLVLFLGSNIGNLKTQESLEFLHQLHTRMHSGDGLLLGVDLKKDPQTILNAYNDREGITRAFNLNLLKRINIELDGNFELETFYHYPVYDPDTGTAKSFLVSKIDQSVELKKIDKLITFQKGEPIFLEISQKYEIKTLHDWASQTGFRVEEDFLDSQHYFVDTLWIKP